jgi:hypothetical protein
LDFVFYRQLKVMEATVLVTEASDHNPILVEFEPRKRKDGAVPQPQIVGIKPPR